MSLEQWVRNGWLQRAEPTLPEIRKLLALVDREIGDAQATGLSNEGRFEHAYNAALQVCMIALRVSGFQAPKGRGRPHTAAAHGPGFGARLRRSAFRLHLIEHFAEIEALAGDSASAPFYSAGSFPSIHGPASFM